MCNVLLLSFSMLWVHIWHKYCSCITLNALYFKASLLITEKKRDFSHICWKGRKAVALHQLWWGFTCCSGSLCSGQQSAYTLYTVFLLSIRLVQPFIPKTQEFWGVPQCSYGWEHPLSGCLTWMDPRCSCLQYPEMQITIYNNGQGKTLCTCGVCHFFLGAHGYSSAGSDRMVEDGKTMAY